MGAPRYLVHIQILPLFTAVSLYTFAIMFFARNFLALLVLGLVTVVVAAPIADDAIVAREAEPEAKPGYGSYGSYGNYGKYGTYQSYGKYSRNIEEAAAPVEKREAEPEPEAKPGYGNYGNYGNYGKYGTYQSYGKYSRNLEVAAEPVKKREAEPEPEAKPVRSVEKEAEAA